MKADQAAALRLLRGRNGAKQRPSRIVGVGSGKGGVGKTNVALNLAIELAMRGRQTCIFDADFGTANVCILAGITPRYTVSHVLKRGMGISEVIVEGPAGLKIVPGSSGMPDLADLDDSRRRRLRNALSNATSPADYLVVDVGAGMSSRVLGFLENADIVLLVTTPEPTSVADAYALLKGLVARDFRSRIGLIVNRAESIQQARTTAERFRVSAMKYLEQPVEWSGFILEDAEVRKAVARRRPFACAARCSRAARSVAMIADRIEGASVPERAFDALECGWSFLRLFRSLLFTGPREEPALC
ncbi:MAG: MinD/ParA family protein [Candidatus Hydrogenedentota bacterium]|nr:MAG: MinD/ParA family protein [Candidatus Hydrogenedentota bacterium]